MTSLGAALLALQLAAPPAATGASPPRRELEERELDELGWMLRQDARAERRERLATGIVKVSAGALQTAMGLYVLLGAPEPVDTVDASGILNIAAGGGLVLDGTLALARRGPLGALVSDPEFREALDAPEGADWIEKKLRKAARRGMIERNVAGSLSLIAGLAIVGLGVANLADDETENDPALTVLGAAEIGAGLGFSSIGIRSLVVPSRAEHTLESWEHRRLELESRPVVIRVSPSLGGVQISGRF